MGYKSKFLLICFVFITEVMVAQQSVIFTQFPVHKSFFNPAFTGINEEAQFSALHRSQWLGYEDPSGGFGAPSSQYADFQLPVRMDRLNMGTGLSVIRDNTGPLSVVDARIAFNWIQHYKGLDWSVGIQPSFKSSSLNTSILNPINTEDPTLRDLLDQSSVSSNSFDLNLGLAVRSDKLTLGLSVLNLLQSELNFSSSLGQLSQEIGLYASYELDLAYKLAVTPFAYLRSDLSTGSFDLGAMATYDGVYSAGLSYRNEESISFLMNAKRSEDSDLKIGLAMDFVISNTSDKRFGTFEMLIQYDLPNFALGRKKIIRTPRFRY